MHKCFESLKSISPFFLFVYFQNDISENLYHKDEIFLCHDIYTIRQKMAHTLSKFFNIPVLSYSFAKSRIPLPSKNDSNKNINKIISDMKFNKCGCSLLFYWFIVLFLLLCLFWKMFLFDLKVVMTYSQWKISRRTW